ncbi:NAD(P)/FAD-dependent oxidoreductase [Hugenholtzia roseola]|uniref:NAD(P)/FAD-dependent oxidoreductase n=1 Tax=Hugenholtzia roseola TaxID=1002 RepID=UPI0003FA4C2C|nr:FAD-dependent oxidoreductase [Hugenholtzia roseola]
MKNFETTYDFFVVGLGIAGLAVAETLLQRGYRVLVMEQPLAGRSTAVAAGLFNPITGRQMVKTWKAELLFPKLHEFYTSLEKKIQTKFFYPTPLYRPFANQTIANDVLARAENTPLYEWADEKTMPSLPIAQPYGGLWIKQAGFIHTEKLLEAYRLYLEQQFAFLELHFQIDALEVIKKEGKDYFSYQGLVAQKLILARGAFEKEEQLWSFLPFTPAKGEILDLQSKSDWHMDFIFNNGTWLIPQPDSPNFFRAGSNYDHHDLSLEPTQKARLEITKKLADAMPIDFEVRAQKVGIRPATRDRKPFVGEHPKQKNCFIFNGLGAKGTSLAPYLAQNLIDFIEGKAELDKEADIKRFL